MAINKEQTKYMQTRLTKAYNDKSVELYNKYPRKGINSSSLSVNEKIEHIKKGTFTIRKGYNEAHLNLAGFQLDSTLDFPQKKVEGSSYEDAHKKLTSEYDRIMDQLILGEDAADLLKLLSDFRAFEV